MRALAAVVAVAAAGALAGAGSAGAQTDPPSPAASEYAAPSLPIVSSLGRRLRAAQGSTCWTTHNPDGTGMSVCGDGTMPFTRRRLRVHSYGVIGIDMGIPVTSLDASLYHGRDQPRLRRLDDAGVHWRLRLPQRFRRTTVLILGANYTQGDAAFGVTLRHVKRPRG